MIAVSSFRALEHSQEIAINQIRAIVSWQQAFSRILLFGAAEPELASPITEFIPCQNFPMMRTLLLAAAMSREPACVINADIVVTPELPLVMRRAFSKGALAASSWRYQYTPGQSLNNAKIVDNGLDFFAAVPGLWIKAFLRMPSGYHIGHSAWDSWLNSFFSTTCRGRFADISPARCIFHPRHGSRKTVYSIALVHDEFTNSPGMGRMKVR